MHYEDPERHINVIGGLLLGALLGTGLALFASPAVTPPIERRTDRLARSWRRRSRRLGWLGEDAVESVAEVVAAGRKRFD